MTARFSLILRKAHGHGPRLHVRDSSLTAIEDLHRLEELEQTRFVTSYGKALIHAGL
jgi:hypothetical protein